MRLFSTEPHDETELGALLKGVSRAPTKYSVAVEGLIFDGDLNWIVVHRGHKARDEVGKFEGIGGRYEHDPDFRAALRREIEEEVGSDAKIDIVDFIEVKWDVVRQEKDGKIDEKNWIIVSYLCKLIRGELQIMEPEKCVGFVRIRNFEVDEGRLTSSAQKSLASLKERWNEFKEKLSGHST
jgi:hypothetical protein